MWYSSRAETDGRRGQPSMDTLTYLHRDVGYGIPTQINKAQEVRMTFITHGLKQHVLLLIFLTQLLENLKQKVKFCCAPQSWSQYTTSDQKLFDNCTCHIVIFILNSLCVNSATKLCTSNFQSKFSLKSGKMYFLLRLMFIIMSNTYCNFFPLRAKRVGRQQI